MTKNFSIFHLEKLYAVLCQCIYKHREDYDKTELVKVRFFRFIAFSITVMHVCYTCVSVRSGHRAYLAFSLLLSCLCYKAFSFQSGRHFSMLQNHCCIWHNCWQFQQEKA